MSSNCLFGRGKESAAVANRREWGGQASKVYVQRSVRLNIRDCNVGGRNKFVDFKAARGRCDCPH